MAATDAPTSAFNQIMSATSNATYHLNPFPSDLTLFIPDFLANAASFAFITVPKKIDNILQGGGSTIAEATGNGSGHIVSAALSQGTVAIQARVTSSTSALGGAKVGTPRGSRSLSLLPYGQLGSLGSVFTYMTSKWALLCFTLVSLQWADNPRHFQTPSFMLTSAYRQLS